MIDKKKVLTGLECCSIDGSGCKRCPYNKDCDEMPDYGNAQLCSDALELLKEQKIGYREKSDAMLKMWMDNDITDGEYGKIMNRLNKKTLNKRVKKDG